MDKLLAVTTGIGQPLRPEDWEFIQNKTKEALGAIVTGLMGHTGTCIITGLVPTAGDGTMSVTAGILFIDNELFYVPAAFLSGYTETQSLYLVPDITTTELRTFKDLSDHDVYESRQYAVELASSCPPGGIPFPALNLLSMVTQEVVSHVPAPAAQLLKYATVTYAVSELHNARTLVTAQGAGTAIKVVSISAWIVPTSTVNVGVQNLDVMYLTDELHAHIGSFPNNFIESATSKMQDMLPEPSEMYVNNSVHVQLSSGTALNTGSANIKFHIYYVVITL
jgi:hypothetical protein